VLEAVSALAPDAAGSAAGASRDTSRLHKGSRRPHLAIVFFFMLGLPFPSKTVVLI
jgi:hypothetical protein